MSDARNFSAPAGDTGGRGIGRAFGAGGASREKPGFRHARW
ncbi:MULTISPECIES: hypothetical protein [unclassified Mesorhizobium]